jgi:uncharacterized protein YPO0396
MLQPLVADIVSLEELSEEHSTIERQLLALPFFFAIRTRMTLVSKLDGLATEVEVVNAQLKALEISVADLRGIEAQLHLQIAGAGGDRLADIDQLIERHARDKHVRRERFKHFNDLLVQIGMEQVSVAEHFLATRDHAASRRRDVEAEIAAIANELNEQRFEERSTSEESEWVNEELRSLQSHPSNIPRTSLELRQRLCDELSIDPEHVPFAGELVQVLKEAREWEGAAERVLRHFALSLLVSDRDYEAVAAWINEHHLNARIVYFRVPSRLALAPSTERSSPYPLLVDMLELKPDSQFKSWLSTELARRANYACVNTIEDFRSVTRAVTRAGQVKDGERHEKDDRRRVEDRRDYVLGWTNQGKIDALLAHASALQQRLTRVSSIVAGLMTRDEKASSQLQLLARLGEHSNWDELDWQTLVKEIAALEAERQRVTSSSNTLVLLSAERDRTRENIAACELERDELQRRRGGIEGHRQSAEDELEKVRALLSDATAVEAASHSFADLETATAHELNGTLLDSARLAVLQHQVNTSFSERLSRLTKQEGSLGLSIVRSMSAFRSRYPQESSEFDDSLGSTRDYRELHRRVANDDLPRFEREFKDYLNQNAIRDIAGFSAQLNKHEKQIQDRIATVNGSLAGIDYNDGRYIRLMANHTTNIEIKEFRSDLRACTDNVVGANATEQYSEEKFLQVKRIIDRFKGREGLTEQDRNWTRRVTDVRQWFLFSASERWRVDDVEYENYSDSAGKSGGQKEKLAYTILAASLAYQFKLDWSVERSKAFQFVVIDEAFSRGSEISTRYALRLFTRLGLQLLIVTPLQKIHVIEPHVAAVGFVDNIDGNFSRLQRLTITEYRRLRSEHNAVVTSTDATAAAAAVNADTAGVAGE